MKAEGNRIIVTVSPALNAEQEPVPRAGIASLIRAERYLPAEAGTRPQSATADQSPSSPRRDRLLAALPFRLPVRSRCQGFAGSRATTVLRERKSPRIPNRATAP